MALMAIMPPFATRASDRIAEPQDSVWFKLSRNSVLKGVPLKIGDLAAVTELEADRITRSASSDPGSYERCVLGAPDWVRLSRDGTSVEIDPPFGKPSMVVQTSYCENGVVMIGGSLRLAPGESDSPRRSWLFVITPGRDPVTLGFGPRNVRGAGQHDLNEVRAIDPVSKQILFVATSEDGKEALVAAPFAIVPRAPR